MPRKLIIAAAFCGLIFTSCNAPNSASGEAVKMSGDSFAQLIQKFDTKAKVGKNNVQFKVKDRDLFFVYDNKMDRMRIISPIAQAGLANEDILTRMLQANYDAVLDARYALGNNVIWSVFIHPLGSLTQEDFLSGVAQVVTAAETFGASYTSGAVVFGGGDSNEIHKDLLDQLEKAAGGKDI